MKKYCILVMLIWSLCSNAQDLNTDINGYHFTPIKINQKTPVKNQYKSGTCWIFSTHSFLESELLRMGKGEYDLSEMFIARAGYIQKAENYIHRQGATSFGQGAENHDVLNIIGEYGIVPHCKIGPKVVRAKFFSTVRIVCMSPPNDDIN